MKFIVDAQLPPALADWLRNRGHNAVAAREVGLRDADDRTIWNWAIREGAIIVTKDEDFALLAAFASPSARVLWVRTGNLVNRSLLALFDRAWRDLETHLSTEVTVVELR